MNAVSKEVRELFEEFQEAEEELAKCKENLEMCFQQIRVNNEPLTLTKFAGIRHHAELLITEAIQLAAMAQKALDSASKRGERNVSDIQ